MQIWNLAAVQIWNSAVVQIWDLLRCRRHMQNSRCRQQEPSHGDARPRRGPAAPPCPLHPPRVPQALMKVLSIRKPLLYSFQTSLPKLPVPPVHATITRVRAGRGQGGSPRWDGDGGHSEPLPHSTWSRCGR